MFKLRQLLTDGSGPDISFFQEVSRKASAHPMGLTKQNCPTCPLPPLLSSSVLHLAYSLVIPRAHPSRLPFCIDDAGSGLSQSRESITQAASSGTLSTTTSSGEGRQEFTCTSTPFLASRIYHNSRCLLLLALFIQLVWKAGHEWEGGTSSSRTVRIGYRVESQAFQHTSIHPGTLSAAHDSANEMTAGKDGEGGSLGMTTRAFFCSLVIEDEMG